MHRFLAVLILALSSLASVNAWAKDVNVLTKVEFNALADYMEFEFQARNPLAPEAISARADGHVLVFRFADVRTKRRWLKLDDEQIKRTLLHPSRKKGPSANLRVRFFEPVDSAVLKNIRVRNEGGRLIAAVPRTADVARMWAGNASEVAKAPAAVPTTSTKAEPKPAPSKMVKDPVAAATTPQAPNAGPMPAAPAPESPEDMPLNLPETKDEVVAQKAEEADEEALPVESGLAQVPADNLNMGAIAMSLLFLLGVGFVLWRRMRATGTEESSGPLIRPVGSHMLGPKQGLLLVEVAGDMVLLGTGEKGVQMLTKIEGKTSEDSQPVAPRVEPLAQPIDANSVEAGTRPAFTERLGQAIERIREVAGGVSIRSESYSSIHDEVAADLDPNDPLASLADGVQDVSVGATRSRASRRDFNPIEPRMPEPVYGGQPPVNDSDDLLAKLRNLQSA